MVNPPNKHHYIPEFYLKRWGGADGRLCQWFRPYRKLEERRVHPGATCYVRRLYEMQGFPEAIAQQVEERFFKPVDSLAAEVLNEFERTGRQPNWTADKRSAWSRFILSLLLRCPEDLHDLKTYWEESYFEEDDYRKQLYSEIREESRPVTLLEFLKNIPSHTKEFYFFEMLISVIDSPRIGRSMNDMRWSFLEVKCGDRYFYTSDRPVVMTNGLSGPQGHLVLPIGPRHLFIAASTGELLREILDIPHRELVKNYNEETVGSAKKFAFSLDAGPRRFFENRFGKPSRSRLAAKALGQYRATRA